MYVSLGQARVLPRKVERRPGCGERPPWPVGPSQTVRRTGRCRGRSPSCCRRHQHRHRRRRRLHPLRPCTASRRPHAPTDLGNPGCTGKDQAPEIIEGSPMWSMLLWRGRRKKFGKNKVTFSPFDVNRIENRIIRATLFLISSIADYWVSILAIILNWMRGLRGCVDTLDENIWIIFQIFDIQILFRFACWFFGTWIEIEFQKDRIDELYILL